MAKLPTPKDFEYYLYIVMRTPIFLGHAGKVAAQAAHAATIHAERFKEGSLVKMPDLLLLAYEQWKSSATYYGTTIILDGGSSSDFFKLKTVAQETSRADADGKIYADFDYGVVFDPSFPATVGDTIYPIATETCFYVFAPSRKSPMETANFTWLHNLPLFPAR